MVVGVRHDLTRAAGKLPHAVVEVIEADSVMARIAAGRLQPHPSGQNVPDPQESQASEPDQRRRPGPDRRDRAGLPQALRQCCLIHRARNVLAKVPAGTQAEVKDAYGKISDISDLATGPAPEPVKIIGGRSDAFAAKYRATYPAAVKILLTDRDGLTAYLRFPAGHHNRIRHSSFIERTFGETRRRVKVICRLPGETSCLSLVRAVLDRTSAGWRGFTMTSGGLRLLQDLRRSLLLPRRQLRPRTVTAARPDDQPQTVRATA
jgi:putative transposase